MNVKFLNIQQVLVIHESIIENYGGRQGIRDLALLESAIYRPQTIFEGEFLYEDLYEMASVLSTSIILNHPFIDGNKRTGIALILVFLEINGIILNAKVDDLVNLALNIATKKWDIKQTAEWIRKNSTG